MGVADEIFPSSPENKQIILFVQIEVQMLSVLGDFIYFFIFSYSFFTWTQS